MKTLAQQIKSKFTGIDPQELTTLEKQILTMVSESDNVQSKFQIACAFQMCKARIENGQDYYPAMNDVEKEIQLIIDGHFIYDKDGNTL